MMKQEIDELRGGGHRGDSASEADEVASAMPQPVGPPAGSPVQS